MKLFVAFGINTNPLRMFDFRRFDAFKYEVIYWE